MRNLAITAVAVPLVLLTACGRTTPADQTEVAPMDTELADLELAAEPVPTVPPNALQVIEFTGSYVREDGSGTERLTLDASEDTFQFVTSEGRVSNGSFTRMEDNRRLAIEDADGQAVYFAVAEGALFRLDNIDTPPEQGTISSLYRRDIAIARQSPAAPEQGAATAGQEDEALAAPSSGSQAPAATEPAASPAPATEPAAPQAAPAAPGA